MVLGWRNDRDDSLSAACLKHTEEDEREDDEISEWDECQNVVQSLECLEVYDLEGLEEDAEVSDGEGIPQEGEFFEAILDEIADQLGCGV